MINYLSLFSGIGAFEKAMDNLQIPFNLVGFSEIDKCATKSYCTIHNVSETLNLGDITKIDEAKLPKVDFITYGFPCQDISLSGKQKGLFNEDGSRTRSGLFFDALRIIEHTQPVVAIAENVKNLISKKFNAQFQVVLASLESVGYNNYWAVLNAKNYGIPQNRERVFIVSIRKDYDTGLFEFPKSFPLEKRLKDVLEDVVDEKYYVNSNIKNCIIHNYTGKGEGQKILVREATKRGWAEAFEGDSINLEHPNSTTRRGRVGKQVAQTLTTSPQQCVVLGVWDGFNQRVKADSTVIGTLTQNCGADLKRNGQGIILYQDNNLQIRNLTPKECFRLMGFKDEDFEKVKQINSNTQLYKQAGNSIVVDVAEELLCMLFDEEGNFFI